MASTSRGDQVDILRGVPLLSGCTTRDLQQFTGLLDSAPEIARNMLPTLARRTREARADNHTD